MRSGRWVDMHTASFQMTMHCSAAKDSTDGLREAGTGSSGSINPEKIRSGVSKNAEVIILNTG